MLNKSLMNWKQCIIEDFRNNYPWDNSHTALEIVILKLV